MAAPQVLDITSVSPAKMEQAYLEYRRACYDIVYRDCVDRGVFDLLRTPRTLEEFADGLGVVPGKRTAAQRLLDALVKHGAVRRSEDRPPRYEAVTQLPAQRPFDEDLIFLATGKRSVAELRHSQSYAGILRALTVEGNPIAVDFTAGTQPMLEEMFHIPFYRYCRLRAVQDVAAAGSRILDLACGPGYGLVELAGYLPAGPGTRLVGIELTTDYVTQAVQRTADDDRIQVMQGNLEQPQDFLRDGYFDGAMMIGAYHFLRDPRPLWATVTRVLRPGGVFCVGYVQSRTGTDDQEIMDLRFALRRPQAYQSDPAELIALARGNGMTLTGSFGLGIWRWYSFTRQ